ncbi:response regulator transcription factor [Agromyces albus]|uniref:Response regulator transcription factor n=1 Tax=Agromyces albus TaxID=205332 RepID=A0A4V1QXQ8_9MICO|nr:response regulator transcription factor [Agromyces albus]
MAIRVGIVDDQALVRIGFRMLLEAEPGIEVVGEAADGRGAIELARTHELDVLLMDVRMPGIDGIAATETIVSTVSNGGGAAPPRIIVLTTFDHDEYAFAALRAGASGFLLKDARPQELITAIRTVHAGDASLAPRVTRRMIELFAAQLPTPTAQSDQGAMVLATLTPREREILVAVAQGQSNGEIASAFHLSESTVKTHVGRVLQKLDARDRVQLVIFAYENGVLPAPGAAAS